MFQNSSAASVFNAFPLPSLILHTDSNFTIAEVNEAFLQATGITEQQIRGNYFLDLFDENRFSVNQPDIASALRTVLAKKEPVKLKMRPKSVSSGNPNKAQTTHIIPQLTPVIGESNNVDFIIYSLTEIVQNDLIAEESKSIDKNRCSGNRPAHTQMRAKKLLQERVKEQTCLYNISNLNEKELSVNELLAEAAAILPDGWQYDDVAAASIQFAGQSYQTPCYSETDWVMSAERHIREDRNLSVKVSYLEERPIHDAGPFLHEERELLEAIANHLALKINQILTKEEWSEKQRSLDKAYQLARIGTWEYDMLTHDLHWSPATKEVHGFDQDYQPDVESTIDLFKEGIDRDTFAQAASDAIEHAKPFDVELKIISGQGDERWIRATGEPEFNEEGVCTRFYGISQNVSDRKQAEKDLQLSEQRFKSLVQDGSDLIAILDEQANYTYVSPTSESILGITASDFIGTNAFDYIHKDDRDRLSNLLNDLSTGNRVNIPPYRFRDSDGNWRWIETTLTNMTKDPAVGGLVANSRDVTQQIQQQQRNLESLKEKETLLAEIHHRVKNNLAVVSGMMQLQAAEEKNSGIRNRLNDSIIRIKTMANIHEQLYQSSSFSKLAFAENIRSLALNIKQTFQSETEVDITFDCDHLHLNINQAIPCSLIVNEVITNIFKHAFPGRKKGHIAIELSELKNGECLRLSVTDDGIGLPADFNVSRSNSLGLNLIDVLSQQLEACFNYRSTENSTKFTIEFEKDELKGIGNSLL